MIILEDDNTSGGPNSGKIGVQSTQPNSTLEPAPPPYEFNYEPPSAALLQLDSEALDEAAPSRTRATSTRRRRFTRFLLVAVVLVVAFTLIRSYSKAPRGGGGGGRGRNGHGHGRDRRRRGGANED
ncbi:hypothetical protein DFH09DRAFT_1274289 [Mycena vulgaris]|nr:hypothetical protein DFH09DRAFT_1274289 [Mycena vulgaris]